MEKKTLLLIGLLLFVISANMEGIASDAFDCYDACSTACVNRDTRLMTRCDRKCQIRCSPDAATSADKLVGANSAGEHR